MGLFSKIKEGLKKTKSSIVGHINSVINSFTKIDEELFEELEEILVMADIGMTTAGEICDRMRAIIKERGITDPNCRNSATAASFAPLAAQVAKPPFCSAFLQAGRQRKVSSSGWSKVMERSALKSSFGAQPGVRSGQVSAY